MMNKLLSIVVGLAGVFFVLTGLRWLVDPSAVAGQFGMTLSTGVGRSTQIGDLAAFFLTLGLSILLALVTSKRAWYYPGMMLLGFAAFGRMVAWLLYDAAFATDMILVEVIVTGLLVLASRRLATT